MSVNFKDLVLIPCMNSFGRGVLYHNQNGQIQLIKAIFDDVTRLQDPITGIDGGNSGIVATRVVMGIRLDDLSSKPDMGDWVTIEGIDYFVQEVQVDGQGGAHLILNNAEV
ncbi:hypothetical protein [Commensalibacter papalotli (ex Botero et al. 2024)]|uniref:head-tail joining protein n=1 Tax=Commensalibacter papalotli (ex Botero et al. 2024) TaxID=2972766 RepID=UPI0022FF69F2|nr:hypothetical protein [Commensalibacter papalotli (ex Botero et al. 2024)]CAI3945470.1 unnamed protein product [Commensalibacter papalotli (ex Botero et al. 2024)]